MAQTPSNTSEFDDISLVDALLFIRRHLFFILSLGGVGLVVGFGLAWMSPKQWEAKSILQIGQIQYSSDRNAQPVLIEPVAQAVGRVKSPPFENAVLKQANQDPANESSRVVALVRKSLSAKPVPNTNLVQISVRAFSPEQSEKILQTVQDMLIDIHAREADPVLNTFRAQLAEVNKALVDNGAQISNLNAIITRRAKSPAGNSDNSLLLGLLNSATQEQQDLIVRRNGLQQQLNPSLSFISKPLGPIAISDKPVYPHPALFAALGLMIGLGAGLIAAGIRQACQAKNLI